MSHSDETEIKLEVRDLRAVRRRLTQLGFKKITPRQFEDNVLYDFADQRLWKARCLLRLRQSGRRWTLTFKGKARSSRDYKIRPETETSVADGKALQDIFKALGLREAFCYQKFRTEFAETARTQRYGAPIAVVDETPIGNYLELEGSPRWIDRVAARMGYSREEYITLSYATLYREKCRERRVKPTNMVFKAAKS